MVQLFMFQWLDLIMERKTEKYLDDKKFQVINADLSSHANLTSSKTLIRKLRILLFLGLMKGGPFDIEQELAQKYA